MSNIINAISKKYTLTQGNLRYEIFRKKNYAVCGKVFLDDKHIATVNYKDDIIYNIHCCTNWESNSIKNILNTILRHFTNYSIRQIDYIWHWNNGFEFTTDNLVHTRAAFEQWKNSDNYINWIQLLEVA